MIRYFVNFIVSLMPPTRLFGLKRLLWRLIGVSVSSTTKINSGAKIWGGGSLSVGQDCWLGMNLNVIVPSGAKITIAQNVDIGPDALLECGSHEIGGSSRRAGNGIVSDISIGSGSWIGCRVTILGGANIAPGSVVAAGALVLPGDYPANALLAGVPARLIRILDEEVR